MARDEDFATIHSLIAASRRGHIVDLRETILDGAKLCPGCMKPIGETGRPAQIYFGEKFCSRCIENFTHGLPAEA